MGINTGLTQHLRQRRFWIDVVLLAIVYLIASEFTLARVVAIVATLDLLSFLLFHFVAKRNSLRLQGFLGGFVSSTAVFLHVLNSKNYQHVPAPLLSASLFYALTAMLFECLLIIVLLAGQAPLIFYVPFATSLMCFVFAAILFEWKAPSMKVSQAMEPLAAVAEHPISWSSVAKFSAIILALILLLEFLAQEFAFSANISATLIALFEAHAVLAASVTGWSQNSTTETVITLFLMILLGNTLGKSLLVWRGYNLTKKAPLQIVLWLTYALTLALTLLALS